MLMTKCNETIYLKEIMRYMGFADEWIKLIMMCVSTVRYREVDNSELSDVIIPTRGLRQGDPLSSYLLKFYTLCGETLISAC